LRNNDLACAFVTCDSSPFSTCQSICFCLCTSLHFMRYFCGYSFRHVSSHSILIFFTCLCPSLVHCPFKFHALKYCILYYFQLVFPLFFCIYFFFSSILTTFAYIPSFLLGPYLFLPLHNLHVLVLDLSIFPRDKVFTLCIKEPHLLVLAPESNATHPSSTPSTCN